MTENNQTIAVNKVPQKMNHLPVTKKNLRTLSLQRRERKGERKKRTEEN